MDPHHQLGGPPCSNRPSRERPVNSIRYFGVKARLGAHSRTKPIHSVSATAAHVHDSEILHELLHGQETWVW